MQKTVVESNGGLPSLEGTHRKALLVLDNLLGLKQNLKNRIAHLYGGVPLLPQTTTPEKTRPTPTGLLDRLEDVTQCILQEQAEINELVSCFDNAFGNPPDMTAGNAATSGLPIR